MLLINSCVESYGTLRLEIPIKIEDKGTSPDQGRCWFRMVYCRSHYEVNEILYSTYFTGIHIRYFRKNTKINLYVYGIGI